MLRRSNLIIGKLAKDFRQRLLRITGSFTETTDGHLLVQVQRKYPDTDPDIHDEDFVMPADVAARVAKHLPLSKDIATTVTSEGGEVVVRAPLRSEFSGQTQHTATMPNWARYPHTDKIWLSKDQAAVGIELSADVVIKIADLLKEMGCKYISLYTTYDKGIYLETRTADELTVKMMAMFCRNPEVEAFNKSKQENQHD